MKEEQELLRLTPFPYPGGKHLIARYIWQRVGEVYHYIEPFFGTGAVLFANPSPPPMETVNDANGFVANFWRAMKYDPEGLAREVDYPVLEADLHARQYWLFTEGAERLKRLLPYPDRYDLRVAAWWAWGVSAAIVTPGRWSAPVEQGGWVVVDGQWVKRTGDTPPGPGIPTRSIPQVGKAGRGVHRLMPGEEPLGFYLRWFRALARRLRRTRVLWGDWSRAVSRGVLLSAREGKKAFVFLDPPYRGYEDVYGGLGGEGDHLHERLLAWCKAHESHPSLYIVLAGYEGDYDLPNWEVVAWKANGGYGNQRKQEKNPNRFRERLWFSPAFAREREPTSLLPLAVEDA